MATVQVLEDGPRNLVIKVDGAGSDSLTKIVDVATLSQIYPSTPCTKVKLLRLWFQLASAGTADLFWEATANLAMLHLFGSNDADMDFRDFMGLPNNAGAGKTGNVLLTTSANAYSLVLHFRKG